MAKFVKHAAKRRSGVSKEKFEAVKSAALASARRAREVASERVEQVVMIAAPAAFGALQSRVPMLTVAGIEPTALYGVALGAAGMAAKGNTGRVLLSAGTGLLAAAAYLVGSGARKLYGNATQTVTVGEDDFEE